MDLVFIGFGEAAWQIASGLHSSGAKLEMAAYDVQSNHPLFGPQIQQRAQDTKVTLLDSSEDVSRINARFILCLTSATSALSIAKQLIPRLRSNQVYVDMNSSAPTVKQDIAALAKQHGIRFCDAAVMGTVPGNQHRVPMLLAGDGADSFHGTFGVYGMRLSILNGEAGAASAIKMLKSVVMKGLPQLFIEAFQGAEKFGVVDTLAASLAESLEGKTIQQLANTFTARTFIHAARRSAEMRDALATLQGVGVNSEMTEATQRKLDWLAKDDWKSLLGANGTDMPYQDAIRILVKHTNGDNHDCL